MNQKLFDYIKAQKSQGRSEEEIYSILIKKGWKIEIIQQHFAYSHKPSKEDTQKRTIHLVLTFAAILVGAGIFSFIAANWSEMAKPSKVILIFVSMLISYGAGWYLREYQSLTRTGNALILLGTLIYGAGIFLLGQIFNIRGNWPDSYILWMFGVIAVALATDLYGLLYLAILLGLVSIFSHPFNIFTSIGTDQFILTSSFLLLIATLVTFFTGYIFHLKLQKTK